ncbi:hypothetical protein ACIRVK_45105 [Streptomyces sp. NPDC101152]
MPAPRPGPHRTRHPPRTAAGQVSGAWEAADGTRARAVFVTVHVDGPARG